MTNSPHDMNYWNYLKLEQILSAQHPTSSADGKPAHDEMLFIIIHQVYELWFKQIIHELDSVREMFATNYVDEKNIGIAVARLERIVKIQKLLVQQIDVIETLTPLDFLDFRGYLPGASGFQSVQFRLVENKLGLKPDDRLQYGSCPYHSEYTPNDRQMVVAAEKEDSLFDLVDKWLSRTPFIDHNNFKFLKEFSTAFVKTTEEEISLINSSKVMSDNEKELRVNMAKQSLEYVQSTLSEEKFNQMQKDGKIRLSFKAFLGALFINLYRDQPILRMPFTLLSTILDIDEHLNIWRHRHSLMVLRMIGSKMGTGGSSGYDYLKATVQKHNIFKDLYSLSTFYLPRSSLPTLPSAVVDDLGFKVSLNR
jgi:tryptophan 2,3-dioxygenase